MSIEKGSYSIFDNRFANSRKKPDDILYRRAYVHTVNIFQFCINTVYRFRHNEFRPDSEPDSVQVQEQPVPTVQTSHN